MEGLGEELICVTVAPLVTVRLTVIRYRGVIDGIGRGEGDRERL